MGMDFDDLLQRLVSTYERGTLVPFIGAGLSIPTCPGWEQFIEKLEGQAGIKPRKSKSRDPDSLVRRAHVAVRTLRFRHPGSFRDKVRKALRTRRKSPPEQTEVLARAWWPLVLTTNYDNCYVAAFRKYDRYIDVLGRSPMDCQRVLTSLTTSSHALLWALQGFLGSPCPPAPPYEAKHLARELVVGHSEYRRVTHREIHFRRAFAEVYRSRSLLFLGSGLRDRYLLELFGEIMEMYGPSTQPHYALMKKGELSRHQQEFLNERYQTVLYEYRSHSDLPRLLEKIVGSIENSACRKVRWSYSLAVPQRPREGDQLPDMELVRAYLPLPDEAHKECLAVSAGGRRTPFFFNESIRKLLSSAGITGDQQPDRPKGHYVARFGEYPIYAVRARTPRSDRHDLRIIFEATEALLDRAWDDGYRRVLMQLLAAGKSREFPTRVPFVQIVRAFAHWRRRHPRRRLQLALHVLEPEVTDQVSSGRLDVNELLSCSDIRFWVIIDNRVGLVERRLLQHPGNKTIEEIKEELGIAGEKCDTLVYPRPGELVRKREPTLESVGVVPGSTLVFVRRT